MVLVIQSILRVHVELKLKQLNISSCNVHFYGTQRLELFEYLEEVDPNFRSLSAKNQVYISLYGSQTNNSKSFNHEIIKEVPVLIDH